MNDVNRVELIANWFPMLILLSVWIIFMRQYQGSKSPQRQYMADHLAEMKRHHEQMERLIAALIARGDKKP